MTAAEGLLRGLDHQLDVVSDPVQRAAQVTNRPRPHQAVIEFGQRWESEILPDLIRRMGEEADQHT